MEAKKTLTHFGWALLLKVDSVPEMLWVIATSFAGVFAFAAAASGWLLKRTTWIERILLAAAGLSLLSPTVWGDILGIALMGVVVLLQVFVKRAQELPPGGA